MIIFLSKLQNMLNPLYNCCIDLLIVSKANVFPCISYLLKVNSLSPNPTKWSNLVMLDVFQSNMTE